MSKITLKRFAEQTSIPAPLVRAVVRQIGGWAAFKGHAQDVCSYGAIGGFVGFTRYTDTLIFTQRQKTNILQLCEDQADECGTDGGIIGFVSGFSCLSRHESEVADGIYNPASDSRTIVYNALAWYALEEVSRAYCNAPDNQN